MELFNAIAILVLGTLIFPILLCLILILPFLILGLVFLFLQGVFYVAVSWVAIATILVFIFTAAGAPPSVPEALVSPNTFIIVAIIGGIVNVCASIQEHISNRG
ncbi:MAG: hypothetical protein ACRCU2_20275 [Planktothrix sp.]